MTYPASEFVSLGFPPLHLSFLGGASLLRLMRKSDLLFRVKRRWVNTTDDKHGFPKYPNLIKSVVFVTFHFAESPTNLLTNPALDPVAKIPEYKVCSVRVEKIPD